jgi:hypothetical protein
VPTLHPKGVRGSQPQIRYDHHWLSIGERPHLYPLARVDSQYPHVPLLVADTNNARILVITGVKTVARRWRLVTGVSSHTSRAENFHLQSPRRFAISQFSTWNSARRWIEPGRGTAFGERAGGRESTHRAAV